METDYRVIREQRLKGLVGEAGRILANWSSFVLEIGCGHGHFLNAYAATHPTRCCIGVDVLEERIERAQRKRARAGLENLHFVRGEAGLFLEALPAHASIDQIFVLFPDPWPKLRHRKHRLIQPEFLSVLAAKSAPGALLCFRTDHEEYFEYAEATLRGHPSWRLVEVPWPFEFETIFQERAPAFRSCIAQHVS